MAITRWNPSQTVTRQEEYLLKRLGRTRKLFGFLRRHRHELFDDAFQAELETMYRASGAGKEPKPPALMAMAMLLQGYVGASDAEAVELTVVDLRWQMVLGRLGEDEPAFSQGSFQAFRERLIAADLDRRLLERTTEIARQSGAYDPGKLPKTLRVAIDSSPLEGAGRVEDTINLLAHAGRKLVACAATLLDWDKERVCTEAGIPLLLESSVKKALDVTWSDEEEKAAALGVLVEQLVRLDLWIDGQFGPEARRPPLKEHVETLHQLIHQDLEPDPSGQGGPRIRPEVAPERRVSVEDKEMRHGRKSKSKRFNGYKRHIATDLDTALVLACAITPANRPEDEATSDLVLDLAHGGYEVDDLYIDRGYINAPLVDDVLRRRGSVICRPWVARNGKLFAKSAFDINMRDRTITCPAGETERFTTGSTVEFEPEACDRCALRARCTDTSRGHGRTVSIADNEPLQHRLRKLTRTAQGRARLRERVPVEHRLAHVSRRQGRRARYRGVRKNVFDLRRSSSITNLETLHLRGAIAITA
jgi:hypothetical protein